MGTSALALSLGWRHFRDIYVMEDNSEILIGAGKDDLFGTTDDEFSATLPPVWLVDLQASHIVDLGTKHQLELSLQITNLLNADWWQRGDDHGVLPGAPRMVVLAISLH